jgi:site-specific recombinase XerD
MLETGASLPVISETLGHTNINTTSIYLKIDLEGLKKCPLDPEGVYA